MAKTVTAAELLRRHVKRRDRVLLLNPPVEETRYSWLRWNQPLDLLQIGARLRSQVGCTVELLDCMQPDSAGAVQDDLLPRDRRHRTVHGTKYPMRRFGLPYGELTRRLGGIQSAQIDRRPTQVWITSLCSYWFESVAEVCRLVRQSLPDAQTVLLGQYPRLMPAHAASLCPAHLIVSTPCDPDDEVPAFDLYGKHSPPFVAVEMRPKVAVPTITAAVARGVCRVTFFTDDVCEDAGSALSEIIAKTHGLHRHIRYHLICGLNPALVTPAVAKTLAHAQVEELHFEETETTKGELNVEAYRDARTYLREAGAAPSQSRSGFVWIGRPHEQLDQLVLKCFQALDQCGGLILKPFTPTPGGSEHHRFRDYLANVPPREQSPHFFPFSELNRITRAEYHDLYRMAAFLNEKVRSGSFDFLKGTLGADLLRESLRKEVWNLEPSPLRLVD